ncbi:MULTISPECIES: hypothetical protein [Bradyrhizobium]|uniref:hypothetical protein n=1 Tax=Bradyrhizobium centrosematis TaxID=1300039 RepID=UPI0021671B75|nr:hypothetical protein [Bradyrhizobium centrosematis]MCS3765841.1 hypothetical protein [Bradyrhizobium centrosematis]MCS3778278.1 hypothetical protein [Bradyrhizobium centrosematis]
MFVTVCSHPIAAARFVGIFVGIVLVSREQTFTTTFAIPDAGIEQMARKNDGACANLKLIRTDVDCHGARPKYDKGAWSPATISDVTGGGLYLFVTPDQSRPGNAASKLWRMAIASTAVRKPTPSALTATARMASSRSPTRGASATRPKTCSRKERPEHREAARQAQAGGRPAFRAIGR